MSKETNKPTGFFFEVQSTKRFFVPLSDDLIRIVSDHEWKRDKQNGIHYGITTEQQSRENTKNNIHYRLLEAITDGEIFEEFAEDFSSLIEKTATLVSAVEGEWTGVGVVNEGEDPKDQKTVIW